MEALSEFVASCDVSAPLYFWIGGALVLLLVRLPSFGKRRGLAIDLQYWKRQVAFKSKRALVVSIPVVLVSLFMTGALADPQFTANSTGSIYGKPVMIVLDVSGSMAYEGPQGKKVSSFEKARGVFEDLIERRPDVSFGLLLYSTEHYIARHFLYKNELFEDTVKNKAEIDFISTGTRTDEALAKARQFLVDHVDDGANKAIVLISDLEVDLEALLGIAEEVHRASLAGIKVYVIAVAEQTYVGQTAETAAEEIRIVYMNDSRGIDQICNEISEMQMSPIRNEQVVEKKSLIPFLVVPALAFIALCLILSETRFRTIP